MDKTTTSYLDITVHFPNEKPPNKAWVYFEDCNDCARINTEINDALVVKIANMRQGDKENREGSGLLSISIITLISAVSFVAGAALT